MYITTTQPLKMIYNNIQNFHVVLRYIHQCTHAHTRYEFQVIAVKKDRVACAWLSVKAVSGGREKKTAKIKDSMEK